MKRIPVLLCIMFLCLKSLLFSQDKVKLSGVMYSDYFYNIDNSVAAKKDVNGFQFRRIYFTADFVVADNFDARFRLESDQSVNSNTNGGKLGVMVKDAYLKWKEIFSGSDLFIGISPTPAFDVSEAAWGYRSLEKTILDLNGIVSSRDFGVDLKGKLIENGSINYWIKYANNSGNAPETDKYKRYSAMFKFKLSDNILTSVHVDYADRADKFDAFDKQTKSNNQYLGSLFLGYKQKEDFSVGVEAFTRTVQNNFVKSAADALQDQNSVGFSVWAWGTLSETLKLVGRFDSYDPNTNNDSDGNSFFMAGLDYKAAKNVSVIPNFQLFNYQATDTQGKSLKDLTARVTLAVTF
ncbi:MAG: OprO/OprP family phosphate-selective porin [Ignavibacteriaceae bacterium]|nr:OprO/OprP family phosphate-selective porin [Ignavibacteriaceae bacterium]